MVNKLGNTIMAEFNDFTKALLKKIEVIGAYNLRTKNGWQTTVQYDANKNQFFSTDWGGIVWDVSGVALNKRFQGRRDFDFDNEQNKRLIWPGK